MLSLHSYLIFTLTITPKDPVCGWIRMLIMGQWQVSIITRQNFKIINYDIICKNKEMNKINKYH